MVIVDDGELRALSWSRRDAQFGHTHDDADPRSHFGALLMSRHACLVSDTLIDFKLNVSLHLIFDEI